MGPAQTKALQEMVEEIRAIRLPSTASADDIAFACWLARVIDVPVIFELEVSA